MMTSQDYDKVVALLELVAVPCEGGGIEMWERCRHCTAMDILESSDGQHLLAAFLEVVAIVRAEKEGENS